MEYATVKSGKWNDPTVWDRGEVPDFHDPDTTVVISHAVILGDGPPNHFESNALVWNPGPGEPRLRPMPGIKYQVVVPRYPDKPETWIDRGIQT